MSTATVTKLDDERLIREGEAAVDLYNKDLKNARARIMPMARGLLAAKRKYPATQDFGDWLQTSSYREVERNDRAALIKIGENDEFAAKFVRTTSLISPELIWEAVRELKAALPLCPEYYANVDVSTSDDLNSTNSAIDQPETHAEAPTTPIQPVSNFPEAEKIPAVTRVKHPIVNMDSSPINPSRTILAKTFGLSGDDVVALLSAYPTNRQKALSAEIMKLHGNHKMRARACKLIQLALEVAKSDNAPNLNKGLGLDIRMFWPHLPEAFCKYIDASGASLAKNFERLTLVNAKAMEMAGASAHQLHNEINHILQHGSERPPAAEKPVVIPEQSRIRHEVKFCGGRIWPSDLLNVTDADLISGWHLAHHWISYLETARPQRPNEIAQMLAQMTNDIGEASSKEGLVDVMRACVAAFLKVNNNAAKVDLSNSMAPGLKI